MIDTSETLRTVLVLCAALGLFWLVWALRGNFRQEPVSTLFLALVPAGLASMALLNWPTGIDHALHDTYYVVASHHYSVSLTVMILIFWAVYRWIRSVIGVSYNRGIAGLHWLLCSVGLALLFWPTVSVTSGLPQRYADYSDAFARLHAIQTAGYFVTLISALAFAICIGEAIYRRIQSGKEPLKP